MILTDKNKTVMFFLEAEYNNFSFFFSYPYPHYYYNYYCTDSDSSASIRGRCRTELFPETGE